MGGKGGDSGSSQQNSEAAYQAQARAQAQQDFAAGQQKAAASEPVKEAPKTEEPAKADETKTTTTDTTAGKDNLTGLGDALVSGLSAGRSQQVADQTARVTADPQTYSPKYDPYSGAFVGQGPYTDTTKQQGQV